METQVAENEWRELLARAERGLSVTIRPEDSSPEACLIKGYLILASRPDEAKDLMAKAQRSLDEEAANLAAVYEARAYEYLGQSEEGRILIKAVLERSNLSHELKAFGVFVLSLFQSPGRALKTLSEISLDGLAPALKARITHRRARLLSDDKEFDASLIEYAGAIAYFEEAGDRSGLAHTYNNMAGVYRRMKRFDDAHAANYRALALTNPTDTFLPNFLDHKAQILNDEGRYADAEKLARQAVQMVDGTQRASDLCENLCTLGKALAAQGKYLVASETLARAYSIGERLDSQELMFKATKARKECAEMSVNALELKMAELALRMCDGSYRSAGKMLETSHTALIKLLKRNSRQWKPKRPQSIILKGPN